MRGLVHLIPGGASPSGCAAKYDEKAVWLSDLKPAFGEREWWFQPTIRRMQKQGWMSSWRDRSRVHKRVTHFGHVEWE